MIDINTKHEDIKSYEELKEYLNIQFKFFKAVEFIAGRFIIKVEKGKKGLFSQEIFKGIAIPTSYINHSYKGLYSYLKDMGVLKWVYHKTMISMISLLS